MTDYSGLSRDDLVARLRAAEARLECYTDLITEHKQVEGALWKREQELSAVFRAVPAGVGLTVQRIFRQANDYFYEVLGYRPDEIIGQPTRMVYPSDDAFEYVDRKIQDQIERTGLAVVETQICCKNGRLVDILLQVAPLVSNRLELGRVFCALDITERKRTMEALRQAKERLDLVIEGADVGLYDVDLRTGEAVLNERYSRMLGYAPGELVMTLQSWRDRIHPDDLLRVDQACEKAQQGQLRFDEEYRMRHKSGAWIWVLDRGKGFDWDENGEPWRLAGTHLDITERKRIEENLLESEERFRLFMDHNPAIAWIKNEEGRYVYLNKSYQQRFCASLDDWRGKTDFELWPADAAEMFRRSDLMTLGARKPIEILKKIQEIDSTLSYWHAVKIPFQDASGRRFVGGIAVDVTAQKRTEQELRARETLLRTIMENSPDPIFMVDRASRLLYANPAVLAVLNVFGYQPPWTQETLVGKTPLDFFGDPTVARTMLESDQRVMESGQVERVEERIAMPGETRLYLGIRSPLRNDAGQVVGLVGIAHDITEQKRSETERLARLERQRDTLVREVHHRIKNHLQGITGLLRNRIAWHPELAEDLKEIIAQICAIAHTYGLQSCRAEGGVRLDELLETLTCAATGPIPIRFSLAPESGVVAALAPEEAVPLALVLNELLTNALKHNDSSEPIRPVRLALETVGDAQRVAIRNGPAVLPAGFDFAAGRGLGTGLELLRILLPPQGATLVFRQEVDEVVAELCLMPPVVCRVEANTVSR